MSVNISRLDRSFSQTEVQDITTAFQSVDTIFDFHQGVSPADSPRMLRIGTNNRRFVQEVRMAVDDFPWLLPGFVTQGSFNNGFDLWFQLDDMEAYLESLLNRVSQTKLVTGHHLMRDCLDIYSSMQHAVHRGVSGVVPYLASAERRFENLGGSSSYNDDPTGPADGGSAPTDATNGPNGGGQGSSDPQGGSGTQAGSGSQGGSGTQDGSGSQDGSGNQGGSGSLGGNGQGMASDNDPAPTSGSNQNGGSNADQGGGVNP